MGGVPPPDELKPALAVPPRSLAVAPPVPPVPPVANEPPSEFDVCPFLPQAESASKKPSIQPYFMLSALLNQ